MIHGRARARRARGSIFLAALLAVTACWAVTAPPAAVADTEPCTIQWPTVTGGEDAPDAADFSVPAGAEYVLRGRVEGTWRGVLEVRLYDEDDFWLNSSYENVGHDYNPWDPDRITFFRKNRRPFPPFVIEGGRVEVSGDDAAPMPSGVTVKVFLDIYLTPEQCDRLDPDAINERNGRNPSNGEGGDPVTTGTGNFLYEPEGVGVLGPLGLTYNSLDGWPGIDPVTARPGVFGPSWTSLLDVTARRFARDDLMWLDLRLPTGRSFELSEAGPDAWTPPPELQMASITRNGTTGAYLAVFNTGAEWSFDANGRLIAIDDGFGGGVAITRGVDGVPTRFETQTGSVTGHAWTVTDTGSDGLVDEVAGPFDASLTSAPSGTPAVSFGYDGDDRLETVSAPHVVGATPTTLETYGYERASLIETVTRHRGTTLPSVTVVSNTFDETDRVVEQVTATGEVDEFTYARTSTGWDTTIDHHDGTTTETVVYHHDVTGRLVALDDPYEETSHREWDRDLPTSSTSRRGGEVTASWDADGRLTTGGLADPSSPGAQTGATAVTYCGTGDPRPVDVTDAAGIVTRTWWTTGTDPYACDAGRSVPVKVTHAHGTALAADTTYTSADGLVTSRTDADGVRTDYSWDAGRGLLLSSTDYPDGPSNPGRTTYYGYDPAGRHLVVRDPGGVETWTVRDAAGRMTSQVGPVAVSRTCGPTSCAFGTTPPTGPTQSWSYDLTGNLLSATDQAGKTTTYSLTYPSGGGRIETVTVPPHGDDVTHPLSQVATVTTSTYDRFDRLTSLTVGDPSTPATLATTTYTYDPLGRLRQTSREVGGGEPDLVESYAYDADGNRTRVTHGSTPGDTDRAVSVRRYDLRGRLVEEWGPTGDTSAPSSVSGSAAAAVRQHAQWVYDDADRLLATITGDGPEQQTTFQRYDAAGRLRYVIVDRDGDQVVSASPTGGPTDATDKVTEYVYTDAGRTEQVVATQVNATTFDWITGNQANKNPTTYGYDGAGQPVSSTNPNGKITTQDWNARGLLEKVTVPGGYWTEYGYDAAGRATRVTNPSPTGTGTVDVLTGYDARGLVTSETDAHPSSTTGAATRSYTHYDDGSLATATNPLGGPTGTVRYAYDARGNRIQRASWTQDSAATAPYEVVDTWGYDLADRQVSEHLAGASGPTTTAYDPDTGRPTVVTQPSGRVETTAYWNSGLVRSVTTAKPADGSGPADTTRTCSWYDTVGQRRHTLDDDLAGTACTAGAVTTETWNPAGTRASVTAPDTALTPAGTDETLTYVWGLDGRLRQITDPHGVQLRWSYSRSGQLARIDRSGTSADVAAYTYDSHGRLSRETTGDGSLHRTYTLHANGSPQPRRIVEQGNGESIRTHDITYRPDGRVATETGGTRVRSWSYDAAGQVTGRTDTAGPDHTYTYGPRGVRLSETVDGMVRTSTYDAGARLVSSTDPGGTTTYGYDPDGRRTDVTLPGAGTPLHTTYDSRGLPVEIDLTATDVQQRTYDAGRRLVEIAETGAPTRTQVWDPAHLTWQALIVRDPSGWQRIEPGIDGTVGIQDDSGAVTPFRQDRQRSTTTSVPVPTAPAIYEPFGQGGDPDLLVGYRGERLTAGLIHLRNRDYDPTTGTFTTRDPLDGITATPTETNPYHYADNDPANKADPLGLSPDDDDWDEAASACAVGIGVSQLDTPAPGPADVVGAGICGVTVVRAGGALIAGGVAAVGCAIRSDCPPESGGNEADPEPNKPTEPERPAPPVPQPDPGGPGGAPPSGGPPAPDCSPSSEEVYRYTTEAEANIASRTGKVPNTDIQGNPKLVFYTTGFYNSAYAAELGLQVGRFNPNGPTDSPTHRITADADGADWCVGRDVEDGSDDEYLTGDALDVIRVDRMGP